MERSMISWNLPNIITISLMAALTWAVVAVVAQAFQRAGLMPPTTPPNGAGGY